MSDETVKFLLSEREIPTHWINLFPDLPGESLPPLNPGTLEPAGPADLTPIFPMGLVLQEVSAEPQVEIPEEVRDAYKLWRPTPLFRARRLERELDTPARLVEALGSLEVELSADDIAELERAVPVAAALGDRYPAAGMASLDSERA